MDENSTYVKTDEKVLRQKGEEPSSETLDYLKMFARSYFVEPSLPETFNAANMN
ncbi:MAG: hypothetical protein RL662_2159 [Bacteroidota bacterium]|jgi:hypothetical protein